MPRNESNRPTARIGRLLDEIDLLEGYCQEIEARIAPWLLPEQFAQLPIRPVLIHTAEEKVRRQITLGASEASRQYMRLVRSASSTNPRPTSFRELAYGEPLARNAGELTEEQRQALLDAIEAEPPTVTKIDNPLKADDEPPKPD